MYFSPFVWVLKWVQDSPKSFYGLLSWALLSYGLLITSFRFLKKNLNVIQNAQVQSKSTSKEKKANSIGFDFKQQLKEGEIREQNLQRELEVQKKRMAQQVKELTQLSVELQNQLDKKETILSEYRSTLQDQRSVIEKKQSDINLLQVRVNDLKYELENVLKLKNVTHEDSLPFLKSSLAFEKKDLNFEVDTSFGLLGSLQDKLDRYVKIAMTLNSSYHLTKNQSRHAQVPLGSLIIDQRRLFDRLQNEEAETLMVYSKEEKRLIFINNQITSLLGWSPERFLTDFSLLIQKNYREWREALEELKALEQKNLRLIMKSKSGKEVLTHCYLKEVPEGVFKGHVIGLLSSPTQN